MIKNNNADDNYGGYYGTEQSSLDVDTYTYSIGNKANGKTATCPQRTHFNRLEDCIDCSAGKYVNESDRMKCDECEPGKYSFQKSSTCNPCDAGRYGTGGSPTAVCTGTCPSGKYSTAGTIKESDCLLCSPGRYGNGGSQTNQCSGPCAAGRYGNEEGSTTDQCTGECPSGKFSAAGSIACSNCSKGYYSTAGQGLCAPCPNGKYNEYIGHTSCKDCPSGKVSKTGSASIDRCTHLCIIGEYSGNVTGECVGCPEGRYSDMVGIMNASECKLCETGRFNNNTGQFYCPLCPAGQYVNDEGMSKCINCAVGTYSTSGSSSCSACPPGKKSSNVTYFDTRDCSGDCEIGKYRDSGFTCKSCSKGLYSDVVGTSYCKLCNAGYFNNDTGQASCDTQCEAGKYSLTGASFCQNCPPGRISTTIGLTSGDDCIPVAAGNYAKTSTEAIPCVIGKYQDEAGQTSCKLCMAGTYTVEEGETLCTAVAAGKYANASGSAIACPVGQFQDEQGQTGCKLCRPGYYNDLEGQSICDNKCDAGKYSLGGAVNCIDCNRGRYGVMKGASTKEEGCKLCKEGSYSATLGATSCIICNKPNTYCSTGATEEIECSVQYYCNGGSKAERPNQPNGVVASRISDTNSMNISWKGNGSRTYAVLYGTSKSRDAFFERISVSAQGTTDELTDISVKVDNLRLGTNYYSRVVTLLNTIESIPSEFTDAIVIPCPTGAYCGNPSSGGVFANNTQNLQGYYKLDNFTFVKCEDENVCSGIILNEQGMAINLNISLNNSGCSLGYRGFMCMKCIPNYTKQGNVCNRCSDKGLQIFVMICCVVIGMLLFLYLIYTTMKSKGNPKKPVMGIIKIALRTFQLLGLLSSFPLQWGDAIKGMLDVFSFVSSAGGDIFSIDCMQTLHESSFSANATLKLSVPLIVLFTFLGGIGIYYRKQFGSPKHKQISILSSIVILMSLHPTLVKIVLSFFRCTDPVHNKSYLIADVDIVCQSESHTSILLFPAIPALVLFIIGIPLFAGMNLFMNRKSLNDSETRETLGFLYSNYEPRYFYWEIVIIMRLVLMACINVIFEDDATLQAQLGTFVLFIAITAHMICQPYQENILNLIEMLSLISSIISLICGSLLLYDQTPLLIRILATISIFVSIGSFMMYTLYRVIKEYSKKSKRSLSASAQSIFNRISRKFKVSEEVSEIELEKRISMTSNPLKLSRVSSKKSNTHVSEQEKRMIKPFNKTLSRSSSTELTIAPESNE